jgi:hypothetical protein
VADLATLNANVMWEVGVRHAWRRSGTVLMRPKNTLLPFDVSHARVHEYRRDETEVGDHDAIAGIGLLRGLLGAVAEGHVDSPVFMTFPELAETRARAAAPGVAEVTARRFMEAISLAADLGQVERLQSLAQVIADNSQLSRGARSSLLEQLGLALISSGCHATAVHVLRPLAEADTRMDQLRLQQRYAHALIRSSDKEGRAQRLAEAERRLSALLRRGAADGETLGLLGSAAKARVEAALAAGQEPGCQIDVAIDAYLDGFHRDPGDCYPGIVALALLRLRGQRIADDADDVARARALLPVVRFATTRLGEPGDRDVWRLATLAELHLHEHLLEAGDDDALVGATARYARVAVAAAPHQRASVVRHLQLMRDAGDPPGIIDPLLALFD